MSRKTKTLTNNIVNWHSPQIQQLFDEKKNKSWSPTKLLNEIEKLTGARPERKITQQQARRYYEMREKTKHRMITSISDRFGVYKCVKTTAYDKKYGIQNKVQCPYQPMYSGYASYYNVSIPDFNQYNMEYTEQRNHNAFLEDWSSYECTYNSSFGFHCYTDQTFNQHIQNNFKNNSPLCHENESLSSPTSNINIKSFNKSMNSKEPTSKYKIVTISESVTLTVLEPKHL